MAIAFRSIATLNFGSHTSPTSISAPSGIANGDILIAVIDIAASSGGTILDITPPAGFTAVTTATEVDNGSTFVKHHVFWKRASSESGSYSFAHNGGTTRSTGGAIAAYSGCIASGSPVDAVSTNFFLGSPPAGGIATALSVTTTVANTMLIIAGHNYDALTVTAASGFTQRFAQISVVQDALQAAAGASGDKTYQSGSLNNQPWQAWLIALKDAAAGGAGKPVKVWSGSAWVTKPTKVWSGSAWVTKPAKVWNGSAWV